MRKLFTNISFLFLVSSVHSQQLAQVTFSGGIDLSYFSFMTDQNVLIRVSPDGKLLEWGIEIMSNRYVYYAPKLQPYMGRIEYYGQESDSVFRGKVKSIGTCSLTYYGSHEQDDKPGKIKSIGRVLFDYYASYEEKTLKGKIKFAGSQMLSYYTPYDDQAYRGKLKSIGSTPITYYSSFEDKLVRGKIKNISGVSYTWYSSYERSDLRGALKTGLYRQNIGSITYIIF
jgi:hypothetical protein